MSIFIGDTAPSKIFVGDTEVSKVFVGEKQVYPKYEWKPGVNTLAYYPLTSVTQATDQSGNSRDLTNTGVIFGDVGGVDCATFTGTITGNTKGLNGNIQLTNYPMTISLWFKTSGNGSGGGFTNRWFLFRYVQTESTNWGSGNYVATAYGNGGLYATASYGGRYGNGYSTDSNTSAYSDGVWHHMVYLLAGSTLQLYIDNVKIGDATGTVSNGTIHVLRVGRNAGDTYYGYNGNMSEFIIEDKIRTAQEISDYYNGTKGNYGL